MLHVSYFGDFYKLDCLLYEKQSELTCNSLFPFHLSGSLVVVAIDLFKQWII